MQWGTVSSFRDAGAISLLPLPGGVDYSSRMSSWARNLMWVWLFAAAGTASLFAATTAETKEFTAASQAFNDRFWERADRELGAFLAKYPTSEYRAEAQLFQAEARIKLRNFAGAIDLLEAGRETAGRFGDEYLFWLAEAQFQSDKLREAADLYARFISEFPNSPRLLDVIVAEAAARSQLKDLARVVELLGKPDGQFQKLAAASPGLTASVRGRFLLAEAEFAQGNRANAAQALEPLVNQPLDPQLAWRRDYLRAQILLAENQPEQALALTTNLASLTPNLPALSAEGNALQARILEQLGQPENALNAWRLNLSAAISAERQREALLHVGDLLIAQDRLVEATQALETLLASGTNATTADVVVLTLGELRLRTAIETNAAASTNLVGAALETFNAGLRDYPSTDLAGKLQLGRGWCLWLLGRTGDSLSAFQAAADALPPSYDAAVARFKLADALAMQKEYPRALTNYNLVAANPAKLEAVQTNLVERALYQVVRMARESGDPTAANAAMAALLEQFPNGFLAERSLMSLGPQTPQDADPVAAREVFVAFTNSSPDSKLLPEVDLAIARTYEQQQDWTNALADYDAWLQRFPEHSARPRAEYYQALATARVGNGAAALNSFTNYISRYPTNEFTPLALWWIADHYWQLQDYVNAETYYQLLFKNHPGSSLRYEAQLMAGRAAIARQRPEEALVYFTNLTSDVKSPTNTQAQAYFAYGDSLMSLPSPDTNRPYFNLEEAVRVFSKLIRLNPDTRIAMLAQGKIGDCYLQLAATDSTTALTNYTFASNAFARVLASTNAALADRAQAEVGLGLAMEKTAQLLSGTNSTVLAQGALDHYLNVVYGTVREVNEPSDMFWIKRAGLEALRLAESMQSWEQVTRLCDTLSNLLPPLQPQLEKRKSRAEEQLRKLSN